jgi:hypothetical protein
MGRAATAGERLWTAPALRLMRRADTADSTARAAGLAPEAPAIRPAQRVAQEAKGPAEPPAQAAVPRTGPGETAVPVVPVVRFPAVRTTALQARPGTRG